jgi:hypothetical protein
MTPLHSGSRASHGHSPAVDPDRRTENEGHRMPKNTLLSSTRRPATRLAALALLLGLSAPAMAGSWQLVEVSRVATAGQSPTIQNSDPNDAVHFLNARDSVWGEVSELTATIVHDGFLNTNAGLDHMALSVRGASMEGVLGGMGYGANAPSAFTYGEHVNAAFAAGQITLTNLHRAISGRGPTFWPAGTPMCRDTRYPCMIFENYTVNLSGPGLVCQTTSPANPCGYDVALPISSANFEVRVQADDWDTTTTVSQGGRVIATSSCRAISGNDARCGPQSGDAAQGDAFVANVVRNTGPGSSGRRLGTINPVVRVLRYQYVCAPNEWNCQIP